MDTESILWFVGGFIIWEVCYVLSVISNSFIGSDDGDFSENEILITRKIISLFIAILIIIISLASVFGTDVFLTGNGVDLSNAGKGNYANLIYVFLIPILFIGFIKINKIITRKINFIQSKRDIKRA